MSDDSNVGSLIPQVFYDVISRIAPGALLIPFLLCSLWGPKDFIDKMHEFWTAVSSEEAPGLLLSLLLLLLSYFAGVLIRGLGYMLSTVARKVWLPRRRIDFEKYYRVKVKLPAAGSRVTKMKAESSMAGVLVIGFSLALAINLARLLFEASDVWPLSFILLSLVLVSEFYRREVYRRLLAAIDYHYNMVLEDKDSQDE